MTDTGIGGEDTKKSTALIVYILYLASLVVGVTGLVGVIIAYVVKGDAPEWLKSHYSFLIRTFWIGLLIGFIGGVLTFVLIGFLILLFLLVWWIVRCVQGLNLLSKNQPVPNPQTWMFL
jgi:uncharacterized membrane protein